MKMTTILFLLFLLLIPSLVVGQTSRSTDAAANKSWPKYYSSFRAAVRNRDRRSLETMMLASYDSSYMTGSTVQVTGGTPTI